MKRSRQENWKRGADPNAKSDPDNHFVNLRRLAKQFDAGSIFTWHDVRDDLEHRMKPQRKPTWESLKTLALGLGLPGVEETKSWGQPTLKAHGKLWVWWSPHEDAPVFKLPIEERAFLVEAAPDTFFVTPHYRSHPLVLVRPERLDLAWAKANLLRVWRAQAPKRVLAAFDAAPTRDAPSGARRKGATKQAPKRPS